MFNTLVIDGDSVFKRGYYGAKNMFNWKGEHIGGLYQFLLFLRRFLSDKLYKKVYVVWDGENSSDLKKEYYPDYKGNRDEIKSRNNRRTLLTEEDLIIERFKLKGYLEELFIRQVECEDAEADDIISYYSKNKDEDENVIICSSDRDLLQLLDEGVYVFLIDKKTLFDEDEFYEEYGYFASNHLLVKALVGDSSDNVQGIRGLGLNTTFKYFPEIKHMKIEKDDVLEKAKRIQENRKKRLKVLDKVIEYIESGSFDLKKRIMDLGNPILTDGCKNKLDEIFDLPLDIEGRSIENFYTDLKRDGLDQSISRDYVDFLLPFKELMEREKRKYKLNIKNE